MTQITGLNRLREAFKREELRAQEASKAVVEVGFTQSYAVWVHEIDADYNFGKQWKYLETPARTKVDEITRAGVEAMKSSGSFKMGLLASGMRLLREAKMIVPIQTGALKASGYVAYEEDADAAAQTAFAESEAIRTSAK